MTMITDATPAIEPAPPAPVIADPAPVRELAAECIWSCGVECNVILELLAIGSDELARHAMRELIIRVRAARDVIKMLPPPIGKDGCVVPGPTPRALQ